MTFKKVLPALLIAATSFSAHCMEPCSDIAKFSAYQAIKDKRADAADVLEDITITRLTLECGYAVRVFEAGFRGREYGDTALAHAWKNNPQITKGQAEALKTVILITYNLMLEEPAK